MPRNTALIAGASGLIGRRIADCLIAAGGWDVIGVARHEQAAANMRWICADLADPDECRRKLGGLTNVTHIFHAARYDHPEGTPESVEINAAMLSNLVSTLEPVAALQHVHALQGSKYYGHQLGPVSLPMREDGPRAPGKSFYFVQENFLRERSRGKSWSYSVSRPHAFCDPSTDHPRSIGLVIAVLATLQRELGQSFDFPGSAAGFQSRTQFTDLTLLAKAVAWMAGEPRCANQAFNVVNGDNPRWSELWPQFASWFGVQTGVPRKMKLVQHMAQLGRVWDDIVKRHGLRATRLDTLVLWAYGDYQFSPDWDVQSAMDKARALGFMDSVDSGAMFMRQFEHYRQAGIIP